MDDSTERITRAVLAYLAANPDAQDTLEGIADWWPLGSDVRPNLALLEAALARLADRGLVLARKGSDARTYYKANRRRLKEISAHLARDGNPDAPGD